MKLTTTELSVLRSQGAFITERCDLCGKVLNQIGATRSLAGPKCSARPSAVTLDSSPRRERRGSTRPQDAVRTAVLISWAKSQALCSAMLCAEKRSLAGDPSTRWRDLKNPGHRPN